MILEITYITIFLQLQLGYKIWNAQILSQRYSLVNLSRFI